jgi:hypothetical protein
MRTKFLRVFSFSGMLLLAACGNNSQDGSVIRISHAKPDDDNMVRANRYLNTRDGLVVDGYIQRHGLKMNRSDFGFYYRCVEKGGAKKIVKGSVVLYTYRVRLVDGTLLDSSGTELSQLVIDKSDGIAGLHEGLKYFHEGDSAQFIFIPHFAYGLVGDGAKIPSRATLVYDVRIKSVQ